VCIGWTPVRFESNTNLLRTNPRIFLSMSSDLLTRLQNVAQSPPSDAKERQALYDAAMGLAMRIERPFDTVNRICLSVFLIRVSSLELLSNELVVWQSHHN
jgi:hypothetical protein